MTFDDILDKLLYQIQHKEEIDQLLTNENLKDDLKYWKPIGDDYGNDSQIQYQAPSPESALGERVINSIDAVLMRKSYENGIDPRDTKIAPSSMTEAAEKFLNLPDGKLGKYQGEYSTLTEIYCTATGIQPQKVTLNLLDLGESQTPDNMKNTFLSLPIGKKSPYKQGIPFVQGRFNQGSTGSYKHCPYTLILTKRPPSLLTSKARAMIDPPTASTGSDLSEIYSRKDQWGWTLVRKIERNNSNERTYYAYLVNSSGVVPSLNLNKLKLMPSKSIPGIPSNLKPKKRKEKLQELKNNAINYAYQNEIDGGTLVKLYDFNWPKVQNADIWSEGIRELRAKLFYETILPVRFTELRQWGTRIKGSGDAAYLTGLLSSILRQDKSKKIIREGWPKNEILNIDFSEVNSEHKGRSGKIKIVKWIIDRTSDNWLAGFSVVYVLNGQVHAREHNHYLKKLKIYNLDKSLMIAVDANELDTRIRDRIFRADRNYMEETSEATLLKEHVEKSIKEDEEIWKANDEKFAETASDIEVEKESSQKIIKKLAKEVPGLAELLKGSEIPTYTGSVTLQKSTNEKDLKKKFGKVSPTFFQPLKKFKMVK